MLTYRSGEDLRIFVLTGAGISAESGLKTFRDNDGLWETHRVEDVATPEAFARDPELVQRFYNERRAALSEVEPNAAHRALGTLQKTLRERGGELVLVTQNVDDLHARGGATNVIHMHGELKGGLCAVCDFRWDVDSALTPQTACLACRTVGTARPDIVWFGEMPYHMDRIEAELAQADQFVSIGTSGAVYPAAGFVQTARANGLRTLELNLEPSLGSAWFDESRHGPAGTVVPEWVRGVLADLG
ncbi:MAG: NAD-dependent deacylase [Pseudomonadota bacterium]